MSTPAILNVLRLAGALPEASQLELAERYNALAKTSNPMATLSLVREIASPVQTQRYGAELLSLSASLSRDTLTPVWTRLMTLSGPAGIGQLLYNPNEAHLVLPSTTCPMALDLFPFPEDIPGEIPARVIGQPFFYFLNAGRENPAFPSGVLPLPFTKDVAAAGLRFFLAPASPNFERTLGASEAGKIPRPRNVITGLKRSLAESSVKGGRKVRRLAIRHARYVMSMMPGQETHFLKHPARLATYALAYGMARGGEINLLARDLFPFFLFLLEDFLENGEPDAARLSSGDAIQDLSAHARNYVAKRRYYGFFSEAALNLVRFSKRRGVDDSPLSRPYFQGNEAAEVAAFAQDIVYFLAERRRFPKERLQSVLTLSIRRSIAQGIHGPVSSEGEFREREMGPIGRYYGLMNYVARRLAAQPDLIAAHEKEVERDFPEAIVFLKNQGQPIRWEEVEDVRRRNLPNRDPGKNPTLLLAGVGRDWAQVERYAAAGYDLILVDPDGETALFYNRVQTKALRNLEALHGVRIVFHQERVNSPGIAEKYANKIDSVEYQNVSAGFRDSSFADNLLKPGGVLTYFTPTPLRDLLVNVGYGKLIAMRYARLLERENIPAVLGSPCEEMAYPLGNHLFVVKKPV